MTGPKFTREHIEETITNYLKKNGSIKNFSDLDIYKKDPSAVFAGFFRMEKAGKLVKTNDYYSLAQE